MKFTLDDVAEGKLVDEPTNTTVEFVYKGKKASVDIIIKALPYDKTEKFLGQLQRGEDVLPIWVAEALIDADGKARFKAEDVRQKFNQTLVNGIYAKLMGEISLPKETVDSGEFDENGEDLGKSE